MLEVVAALAEVCDYTDRPDEAAKWRAELATLRTLHAALDKAFYHGDLNDYTNLGLLVPGGIAPKSGSKAGRVFYCPDADRFLSGQVVDATSVLVKYTYDGDATLDGGINIDDYGRIDANVASSGSVFGYASGDFNLDGKINVDDYGIIDGNVNRQGAAIRSAGRAADFGELSRAVPEPASLTLLVAGWGALRQRRRRRATSHSPGRGNACSR